MANSKSKPFSDLLIYLHDRLNSRVVLGQHVTVALSGGVDSVVLLHATVALAKILKLGSLNATHIHHGLSPHADEWASFCQKLCARLGVEYQSLMVDVHMRGVGVEAAAREARYEALEVADSDWILLAHHRDDQAETLLLNLLRGASVHGAAGMREVRGRFLRPFLGVAREQLVAYARHNDLSWVADESNLDSRYSRNHLRNNVMPLLEQPFPGASATLARAAQTFGEAAELLEQVAQEDMGEARLLNVAQLRALSLLRATNLLAYYLRLQGVQIPGNALLKEMLRQMMSAKSDSAVYFKIGDREVRRFRDQVLVERVPAPVFSTEWSGAPVIQWGDYCIHARQVIGEGVAAAMLGIGQARFAVRHDGAAMALNENGSRRPLKDVLREAGVPPWRRKSLPVLYVGDEVAWVAGIGISAKYRCKPGAEGFLIEFDGVTW
jgi:tRNA(Ile)-lysidine synthase